MFKFVITLSFGYFLPVLNVSLKPRYIFTKALLLS